MDKCVKINFRGKEYFGYLKSVEGIYEFERQLGIIDEIIPCFIYYEVSIYDKDTFCVIDGITITSLDEIEIINERR